MNYTRNKIEKHKAEQYFSKKEDKSGGYQKLLLYAKS